MLWKPLIGWNVPSHGLFLRRWVLGKKADHTIKDLYSYPSASVLTGQLSFALSSWQSKPSSPSPFVLSLEPPAQMVHQTSSFTSCLSLWYQPLPGIICWWLFVFMEESLQTIPILLSICEEFGSLSDFRINWSKSALIPLNEAAKSLQFPVYVPVAQHHYVLRYRNISNPKLHCNT